MIPSGPEWAVRRMGLRAALDYITDRPRIGTAIRDLRQRRRLSFHEAAEAAGVDSATLHRAETGKGRLSLDNYAKVIAWLEDL